jgi:ParB family chromosome partitioning protein
MVSPRERNQRMKSLFGNVDPEALARPASPSPSEADKKRVGSSAVKSMDRAFVSIEEENRRLHDQINKAESVVELDPDKVVPSFVSDRITIDDDPGFEAFVQGMEQAGQKLPILVRPLAGKPGHYQVAYGHRRLRASQILKRPVKAVVRDMTDDELVISQGIENAERLNLSFIEQALFALTLKNRGFSRETIADALGWKEGRSIQYVSILTNTAAALPDDLVRSIGAAPSTGRPKWEKLGALIKDGKLSSAQKRVIDDLIVSLGWKETKSDDRFGLVLEALSGTSRRMAPDLLNIPVAGGVIINAKRTEKVTRISIPDQRLPGLSEWLLQRLPELVDEFQADQKEDPDMT